MLWQTLMVFCARCKEKGKSKDPCVEKPDISDCKFCLSLTDEQRTQLPLPPIRSLVDLASVSVIGAVDGQETLESPGFGGPEEKSRKVEKDKVSTSKSKSSADKLVKTSDKKLAQASSTDTKISELNQKWSDRFNRLELCSWLGLWIKNPLYRLLKLYRPTFYQLAQLGLQSPSSCRQTDLLPSRHHLLLNCLVRTPLLQSISPPVKLPPADLAPTDQELQMFPNPLFYTDNSLTRCLLSLPGKDSISSMESDVESELPDRPPVDIYVEGELLDQEQDVTVTDPTNPSLKNRLTERL